jgi:hypothetical protein
MAAVAEVEDLAVEEEVEVVAGAAEAVDIKSLNVSDYERARSKLSIYPHGVQGSRRIEIFELV